jgi:hypothetical protein
LEFSKRTAWHHDDLKYLIQYNTWHHRVDVAGCVSLATRHSHTAQVYLKALEYSSVLLQCHASQFDREFVRVSKAGSKIMTTEAAPFRRSMRVRRGKMDSSKDPAKMAQGGMVREC